MVLHIFNPDTDFALASNSPFYTPPSSVIKLRKSNALLPATYANKGDLILLLDDIEEVKNLLFYDIAESKGIEIIDKKHLSSIQRELTTIHPWGWNLSLRNLLLQNLGNLDIILSHEKISSIRQLSHRRTTFQFRQFLKENYKDFIVPVAAELNDENQVIEFYKRFNHVYIKAPWSSSGRGVINTANMTENRIREWSRGCIRSQGSVIVEEGFSRSADFATEWIIKSGKADFLGFSFFNVTKSGSYSGNMEASQNEIINKLNKFVPGFNTSITSLQKMALEQLIAPFYEGPLGIDMFSDCSGKINPCVEINLRMTMGIINILQNNE